MKRNQPYYHHEKRQRWAYEWTSSGHNPRPTVFRLIAFDHSHLCFQGKNNKLLILPDQFLTWLGKMNVTSLQNVPFNLILE